MKTENEITLEARGLMRVYRRGSEEIRALDGVSLQIRRGEFVSFMGPSGSGKTTLVNLLGCLDNPSTGELYLTGRSIFGNGKTLDERAVRVRAFRGVPDARRGGYSVPATRPAGRTR